MYCNGHDISPHIQGMLEKFFKTKKVLWKPSKSHIKSMIPVDLKVEVLSTYEMKGVTDKHRISRKAKDCSGILNANPKRKRKDGVYVIYPDGHTRKEVFCDMTTEGGGWTVIQRRKDGSTDFYRTWKEYKHGFGDPSKNYWIGNDVINILTNGTPQLLRVDLQRFNGEKGYAKYSRFSVDNESNKYKLNVSGFSGTIGDALKYQNNMKFTTKDQDNDRHGGNNCAQAFHGAWWYDACHGSNLNGLYTGSAVISSEHPVWYYWKGKHEALKRTQMMIRPKNK
ncbi:techylectin-5B-like [Saccostrea echinata]|uniref:techylectin-5B-like n=1 Tax=Saccostrea echinata TaxID=191078 RepID=UPI002A7F2B4D|nr:techylectin-5B-like [Saccostrea echinata]